MSESIQTAFIDRSFDNFFTLMDREKLHEPFAAFCAQLGYSAVSEYLLAPDTYQMVSADHDVLDLTEYADKIPVTGLQFGDSVDITAAAHDLHPARQEAVTETMSVPSETAIASVWALPFEKQDCEDTIVVERYQPLMVINMSPRNMEADKLCPTVVGHELIHLAQNLSQPYQQFSRANLEIEVATQNLDHEIEAYTYQAELFEPLMFDIGRVTSVSMAGTIDAIRRVTLRNGYKSNQAFIEKARTDEFANRIMPNALL